MCEQQLVASDGALRCARRHAFDVARQGYVNLLSGHRVPAHSDTPEMLRARDEFLRAGHYEPVVRLLTSRVPPVDDGALVLDAGVGTGQYLRAVLGRLPGAVGLAADVSKHAVRYAVRGERRTGGMVCDLWHGLPLRSGTVSVLLSVFAPRNGAEFRRVLRADGTLLVVTPTSRHLAELVSALELLTVDERKLDRLDAEVGAHLRLTHREECEFELALTHDEASWIAGMGPSARHLDAETLRARVAAQPEPVRTTGSVTLSVYRP